ncbi:MAG: DUF742 domain-containing protein [Acidimicrobiales bacterium]
MTDAQRDPFTSLRVRPYLLTGGRTRSSVDLPLEALIRTTDAGHASLDQQGHERRSILELCADRQSLAEISAHLTIHLQVAKVLVGDLLQEGLVASAQSTATTQNSNERPDLQLLERVLDGLQSL